MRAAWRRRVGDLRFDPAVLLYVVEKQVVVQVRLQKNKKTGWYDDHLSLSFTFGQLFFVFYLPPVEELSSKQNEFIFLRVCRERRTQPEKQKKTRDVRDVRAATASRFVDRLEAEVSSEALSVFMSPSG